MVSLLRLANALLNALASALLSILASALASALGGHLFSAFPCAHALCLTSGMRAHVPGQVTGRSEGLTAGAADVGLASGMRALVHRQPVGAGQILAALGTFVWRGMARVTADRLKATGHTCCPIGAHRSLSLRGHTGFPPSGSN